MHSAVLGSLRRSSTLQRLELAAALTYAVVFAMLLAYGRPGLGLGQGFYLAIVLLALTGGPITGVAAGVLATALYVIALLLTGQVAAADIARPPVEIRFAASLLAGLAVGYFAQRGRQILATSLHILDNLLLIARRDLSVGALDRGFLAALERRTAQATPFTLLVGDLASSNGNEAEPNALSDDELRLLARTLADEVGAPFDIARVNASRFAIAGPFSADVELQPHAATLEAQLDAAGYRATFGWAFYPEEGGETLSLFMTATERLCVGALERDHGIRPEPR